MAQAQAAATPVDPRIVAADNQLGLNLLATLTAGGTSNVSISPTSVALVLQILYNGAEGSAQTAMAQTLQLGTLTVDEVNTDNAALQAALDGLASEDQLTIANSLWAHGGSSDFEPDFVQLNETYYGATVGNLDGPAGTVEGDPDTWVSTATDGLITSILPAPIQDVVFMVANAIYFKGAWTSPFNPDQTTSAPFTLADGSQVTCSLMNQTSNWAYYKGSSFQSVSLPYGKGRASMLILLPDPGVSLATLLASLSAADLDTVVGQQVVMAGQLALPRFNTSFDASLVPALTTLGMGAAFGGDFSGIGPNATLNAVLHATVVEVDEQGTIAAGATSGGQITAVEQPEFTMTVDRPFLYAIRDGQTGALLFVGVLFDPTSS